MYRIALLVVLMAAPVRALASDRFIGELQRKLDSSDANSVNAYLSEHWETANARLANLTQRCNPDALRLSLQLLNTSNLEALGGHHFSLQVAMGRCPGKLLPLVPDAYIADLCSVGAFVQTAPQKDARKEIERRLQGLRRLDGLYKSAKGQSCAGAYSVQKQGLQK